jgi:hypothetical protein
MSVGYGAAYDVSGNSGGVVPPGPPVPAPTLNGTRSVLGFSRPFDILYQSADLNYGAGDPENGFAAGIAIRLRDIGGDHFMVGNYDDAGSLGWAIGSTSVGITDVDQVYGFFLTLRQADAGTAVVHVYVRASDHMDRTMLLGFHYAGEAGGRFLTPWCNGAVCGDPQVLSAAYAPAATGLCLGANQATSWASSQHDIIGAYFIDGNNARQDDVWRTFRRTGRLSKVTTASPLNAVYNAQTLVGDVETGSYPWPLTWENEGEDAPAGDLTHSIDPPVDNAEVVYDTNPAFSGVTTTQL